MIPIVINADDYGLSDGICRAINELLYLGAVSNTTVMVGASNAVERSKRWGIANLKGAVGLHLQLSDGKPVSPPKDVPSLINPTTGQFLPREQVDNFKLEEVELEWERQLELVTELLNSDPTHLDSHKGIHRHQKFSDLYLSLASKYKLSVRGGTEAEFIQKMKSANVKGSTMLLREWTGNSLGLDALKEKLISVCRTTTELDVVEVVTHPGYNDEYLEKISSLNSNREDDRLDLLILQKEGWLTKNGFKLVRYPSLG